MLKVSCQFVGDQGEGDDAENAAEALSNEEITTDNANSIRAIAPLRFNDGDTVL